MRHKFDPRRFVKQKMLLSVLRFQRWRDNEEVREEKKIIFIFPPAKTKIYFLSFLPVAVALAPPQLDLPAGLKSSAHLGSVCT